MKALGSKEIEALCERRIELIGMLEEGLLTKESFILENFNLMSPYQQVSFEIKSVEEGVIKYHYFNTLAKKMMLDADALEFKDARMSARLRENAYTNYLKKDKITLNMLELVDYKEIEAYFIHMKSKSLEGQIYEIRFNGYEKVVLHSKDRKILYKLKTANCFFDERLESVIDDYVNTRIY